MRPLFLAAVIAVLLPTATLAQNQGTCSDPIDASAFGDATPLVLTLDTRIMENEQESQCADTPPTTGPDIVLDFRGGPAGGTITWEADFDAIVYYRRGTCDSPCAGSSTSGTLDFDCDYGLRFDGTWFIGWDPPFLIVDGLNGASGTITVTITGSLATPTLQMSWGSVKDGFR
jgi:hypothetical protein